MGKLALGTEKGAALRFSPVLVQLGTEHAPDENETLRWSFIK